MTVSQAPAGRPASPPRYEASVQAALDRTVRRIRLFDSASAGFALLSGIVLYGLVLILLDSWLTLAVEIRLLGLLGLCAGALFWMAIGVIGPLWRGLNPLYAAVVVEQTVPGAKNSVVNWLDLRDRPLPAAIRGGVAARAAREIARADIDRAVPVRPLLWQGGVLLGLLAAGIVVLSILGWDKFASLCQRCFAPFADTAIAASTQITIILPEGGDAVVPVGHPVTFVVKVTGRVPAPASADALVLRFRYSPDEQLWQERHLVPGDTDGDWICRLPSSEVHNGFWYHISGGDARTAEHRIQVRSSPMLTDFEVVYKHRPYRRLPETRGKDKNLIGWPGTEATITARTNRTVREGRLTVEGKPPLASAVVPDDPQALRFHLVLEQSGKYRIRFVSRDGEPSGDSIAYEIKVQPDNPPQIEITHPETETIAVPANSALPVKARIEDDHGISDVVLRMRMKDGPGLEPRPYEHASYQFEDGSLPTKHDYLDFIDLARLRLQTGAPIPVKEGDVVEFWLEAEDDFDYPKPQVGKSKVHRIRVIAPVPDKERKQEQQQAAEQKKDHAQKTAENRQKENEAKKAEALEKDPQARAEHQKKQDEQTRQDLDKLQEKVKQNQPGQAKDEKQPAKGEARDRGKTGQGKQPDPGQGNDRKKNDQPGEARPQPKSQQGKSPDGKGHQGSDPKGSKEGQPGESKGSRSGDPNKGESKGSKSEQARAGEKSGKGGERQPGSQGGQKSGDPKSGDGSGAGQKSGDPKSGDGTGGEKGTPDKGQPQPGGPPKGGEKPGSGDPPGGQATLSKDQTSPAGEVRGEKPSVKGESHGKPLDQPKAEQQPGQAKDSSTASSKGPGQPGAGRPAPKAPDKDTGSARDSRNHPRTDDLAGARKDNATAKDVENLVQQLKDRDPAKQRDAQKQLIQIAEEAKDARVRETAKDALQKAAPGGGSGGENAGDPSTKLAGGTSDGKKSDLPADGGGGKPKTAEPKQPGKSDGSSKTSATQSDDTQKSPGTGSSTGQPGDTTTGKNQSQGTPSASPGGGGDGGTDRLGQPGPSDPGTATPADPLHKKKAAELQLDQLMKKVTPDMLKEMNWTEDDLRNWHARMKDRINRDYQKDLEQYAPPQKSGKVSIGGPGGVRTVDPGAASPQDLRHLGKTTPAPEFRNSFQEFTQKLGQIRK
jgi:flagellar biosynthesis GTPase FlhF